MFKLYSLLIGEDPVYTATFHPSSKRKIALLASCMVLPIILWFLNGYMLVSHVLGGGTIAALLTATILAIVIFLIERAVIMSKGNNSIAVFRILLGLVTALLGSISMDEVVFKKDIDNKVSQYKRQHIEKAAAEIDSTYQHQIFSQSDAVHHKYDGWRIALKEATGEADGTSGSEGSGVGRIAKFKMGIADKHEKDYKIEILKLDSLKANKEIIKQKEVEKAAASFETNALLLRIKVLFELVGEDIYMCIIYVLFTLLLFLIEFLVVVIKLCSSKSIDEELEEARINLLRSQTQKTISKAIQYHEPEATDFRIKNAKRAMEHYNLGILL